MNSTRTHRVNQKSKTYERYSLRYIDRKKVRGATVKINKIVSLIKTETITETNSVLGFA